MCVIKVEHHALSGTAAMYAGRNSPRTWQACTTIDYQMIHKSLASQWLTGRLLTTCLLYIACYWLIVEGVIFGKRRRRRLAKMKRDKIVRKSPDRNRVNITRVR